MCRALEVVAPLSEGLEYGKQFFVIDLIVELRWLHAAGIECDRVDVAIIGGDLGDDHCDSIVRSVSFNNNWVIGVEVHQDGCLGKGCFERFERLGVIGAPGEWGVLAGEANQGNYNVGEPHNELAIEVGKASERLDCLKIGRSRPGADSVSLGHVHRDASGGDHEAQEFNLLHVEQALLGFGVQVILAKVIQDMSDVNLMLFQRVCEDEDVVEVDNYEHISHVSEDMVHEGLECSGSVGKSHWHDQELERAIACSESCLPLVACCNANIIVASAEVELGVDLCASQLVKEVGDEWDRVLIFSCDPIEVVKVDTESQG